MAFSDMSDEISLTSYTAIPTVLYRAFDADGALLYVGITTNLQRRLAEHREWSWGDWYQRTEYFTTVCFPSVDLAARAEAIALRNENPLHNKSRREGTISALKRPAGLLTRQQWRQLSKEVNADAIWYVRYGNDTEKFALALIPERAAPKRLGFAMLHAAKSEDCQFQVHAVRDLPSKLNSPKATNKSKVAAVRLKQPHYNILRAQIRALSKVVNTNSRWYAAHGTEMEKFALALNPEWTIVKAPTNPWQPDELREVLKACYWYAKWVLKYGNLVDKFVLAMIPEDDQPIHAATKKQPDAKKFTYRPYRPRHGRHREAWELSGFGQKEYGSIRT